MRVEFVFDYPSPYAYLASTQLESLGVPVGYEPIGIVEVMKRVDNQPSPACPPKARCAGIDAARWAHRYGVPFEINQAFLTALGTGTFDHQILTRGALPVRSQALNDTHHAGGKHIGRCGQDARQFHPQEALSLSHRDAPLHQEGSNLIDDASALADQPLTDAMQSL